MRAYLIKCIALCVYCIVHSVYNATPYMRVFNLHWLHTVRVHTVHTVRVHTVHYIRAIFYNVYTDKSFCTL